MLSSVQRTFIIKKACEFLSIEIEAENEESLNRETIMKSFRKMALLNHPDARNSDEERFIKATEARNVLFALFNYSTFDANDPSPLDENEKNKLYVAFLNKSQLQKESTGDVGTDYLKNLCMGYSVFDFGNDFIDFEKIIDEEITNKSTRELEESFYGVYSSDKESFLDMLIENGSIIVDNNRYSTDSVLFPIILTVIAHSYSFINDLKANITLIERKIDALLKNEDMIKSNTKCLTLLTLLSIVLHEPNQLLIATGANEQSSISSLYSGVSLKKQHQWINKILTHFEGRPDYMGFDLRLAPKIISYILIEPRRVITERAYEAGENKIVEDINKRFFHANLMKALSRFYYFLKTHDVEENHLKRIKEELAKPECALKGDNLKNANSIHDSYGLFLSYIRIHVPSIGFFSRLNPVSLGGRSKELTDFYQVSKLGIMPSNVGYANYRSHHDFLDKLQTLNTYLTEYSAKEEIKTLGMEEVKRIEHRK